MSVRWTEMQNGYSLQLNESGRVIATIQKLDSGAFEAFFEERSLGKFIDHSSAVLAIERDKVRAKECDEAYVKYMKEHLAFMARVRAEAAVRRAKRINRNLCNLGDWIGL